MRAPGAAGLAHARLAWIAAAHLALVLWLFGGTLAGRLPYFRDITFYYFPNDVFLERWLRRGVWPLWNPEADGGAPFLVANPIELLSVWALGARGALGFGLLFHSYLALLGGSALARRLGLPPIAAWLAGALYGLSGYVLSTVNLRPLFEACALAPWVLWALLGLLAAPSARAAALLGSLAALQLLTLGVEIVVQTALAGLLLAPQPVLLLRRLRPLALAGLLALSLAAPALLGAFALTRGTQRSVGFTPEQALGYSASPMVLVESLLPRLFGDVHSFSDAGYWGQPFFPEGYPYLISLYVGPLGLGLALSAGRSRLWWLVAAGLLLSLGAHGPLAPFMARALTSFRVPVKFFFLTTLGLALLSAKGLARLAPRARTAPWLWLAGLVPLAIAAGLVGAPDASLAWTSRWLPETRSPLAVPVLVGPWPGQLLTTGALGIAAALLLASPLRAAAALLPVLDLLIVNGTLNPLTAASYYELQPRMRAAIERTASLGSYRWFGYGLANSPPVPWRRVQRSDVWRYYMDRQSLLPRAPMLDGLASAYDVDRTGWAPRGSTLSVAETSPLQFRNHWSRLRLANVRFVLSWVPLPEDLTSLREAIPFDEMATPLWLYEIPRALPLVFWVARQDAIEQAGVLKPASGDAVEPASGAGSRAEISFERPDPHTLQIRCSGPAGYVVVVEGSSAGWRATSSGAYVPLLQANERSWALPVPEGGASYTVRYDPEWRRLSLGLASGGLLLAIGMALRAPRGEPRA